MKRVVTLNPTGQLATQISHGEDLVSYQVGAVVSRQMVSQPGGSVTIFAVDQGQGLNDQAPPFDALAHVLEGEVEIHIAGKLHFLRGGEMILLPARQAHALMAITRFKIKLSIMHPGN